MVDRMTTTARRDVSDTMRRNEAYVILHTSRGRKCTKAAADRFSRMRRLGVPVIHLDDLNGLRRQHDYTPVHMVVRQPKTSRYHWEDNHVEVENLYRNLRYTQGHGPLCAALCQQQVIHIVKLTWCYLFPFFPFDVPPVPALFNAA